MSRAGGRRAVMLLGVALAAVVVLRLWLLRHAGDDTSPASRQPSRTAGESGTPPALPTFEVEPLADGAALAGAAGEPSSSNAAPLVANPTVVSAALEPVPAFDVHVVDASGRPHSVDRVMAGDGASQMTAHACEVGTYRFNGLPPGPTRIMVELKGQDWELDVDTTQSPAIFQLPSLGSLQVSCTARHDATIMRVLQIVRVDAEFDVPFFVRLEDDAGSTQAHARIEELPAGEYDVWICGEAQFTSEGVKSLGKSSEAQRVTVKAGKTTEVVLSP